MKIQIDNNDNNYKEEYNNNRWKKCEKTICFLSIFRLIAIISLIIIVIGVLLLFKAYIKFILLWLETQNLFIITLTILILFIIVSLPISIGYILLVIATGYLFGLFYGFLLAIFCANFGLFIANYLLKFIRHYQSVYRLIQNQTAQAIIRVISGPLAFKIVFCSRLTPIPFGLQNTIFALSNVNIKIYHIASLFGLFPGQFVGVYVGSTLRSMQDVLENQQISSTTYILIVLQLTFAVFLIIWFGTKARTELLKLLAEANETSTTTTKESLYFV